MGKRSSGRNGEDDLEGDQGGTGHHPMEPGLVGWTRERGEGSKGQRTEDPWGEDGESDLEVEAVHELVGCEGILEVVLVAEHEERDPCGDKTMAEAEVPRSVQRGPVTETKAGH